MPESLTLVTALKFRGGVVIAADSQVTDSAVGIRWPIEKLVQVGKHPLVVGFSGSGGKGKLAGKTLQQASFKDTTFLKPERVEGMIVGKLQPIYGRIQAESKPPYKDWQEIALTGLAVFWAGGRPHLLEMEKNGDIYPHDYFHALGSAGRAAYAVYNTLAPAGEEARLLNVDERKTLMAILRIVRTAINVEAAGVSEPIQVYIIRNGKVRSLLKEEIGIHMQAIGEWESDDRDRFYEEAL